MHRTICLAAGLILTSFGCGTSPTPIAGGKSVEHWLEASTDADPKIRLEAIKKLGNIGSKDRDALSTILDALGDPSPAVRKVAVYAVVRNRQASLKAVPLLEEMEESDPDSEIRKIASEAHQNIVENFGIATN